MAVLITGNVTYEAVQRRRPARTEHIKTLTPAEIAQMDGRASDSRLSPTTTCYAPSTNQAAIAYFKQFPLANSNGTGDGYNTGSYNFTSPAPIHQIHEHRPSWITTSTPRQTLFVRGNLQSDNQATALQFPGLPAAVEHLRQ